MFFNKKRLKKFAFFIIVFIIVIFLLHNKGYCDFTPSDSGNLAYCRSSLSTIEIYTRSSYDYLGKIWVNTNHLDSEMDSVLSKLDLAYEQNTSMLNELNDIESVLNNIDTSTDNIEADVNELLIEAQTLRTILTTQLNLINQSLTVINTTIQNESDDIQDTLSNESDDIQDNISQNFSDLQELLTEYMFGQNYNDQTYNMVSISNGHGLQWNLGNQTFTNNQNVNNTIVYYFELPHSTDNTYNFKLNATSGSNGNLGIRVGFSNSLPYENGTYNGVYRVTGAAGTGEYSFSSNTYGDYKYLLVNVNTGGSTVTLTGDYNEVMDKGSTQSIMDNQSQNADMINNSITDSNVDAPFSDLPSDSTQDITESGFTNIFDTIRTTFTSGVARDLVVPIPFTGKSFTINTGNVYGNVNLGIVGTLIESFWYFVFSFFIGTDIARKINKIKMGDLENIQTTNIKEDLLW